MELTITSPPTNEGSANKDKNSLLFAEWRYERLAQAVLSMVMVTGTFQEAHRLLSETFLHLSCTSAGDWISLLSTCLKKVTKMHWI